MDVKISKKETRLMQRGAIQVYVNSVFDAYPILDETGFVIEDVECLNTDVSDLEQAALFASLMQKGTDPLNPTQGVRWAEYLLGEITDAILMADIKNAVEEVSTSCSVTFQYATDSATDELYMYYIVQVVQ